MFLDNLGCVFIPGGVIPAFDVGGKACEWFVSGGSSSSPCRRCGFIVQAIWQTCTLIVRSDFLSLVSKTAQDAYRLLPSLFRWLNEHWARSPSTASLAPPRASPWARHTLASSASMPSSSTRQRPGRMPA